jgi:CDP-diacylglycerol---glycerol-3-phosphate 3-phosphatidyltransferase
MTLYALKPRFQAILRPLTGTLARAGVTANQVTIAAAIGSVALGISVASAAQMRMLFLLLPLWLFLRMALNAIDGMLAREFGQKSRLGAYLNEIADLLSDAALMLPFAMLPVFGPLWIGIVAVLTMISEFAGVMGPSVGASRRYDGPLGKSDRALAWGALALWIGIGGAMPGWLFWLLPLIAAMLLTTTINRVQAGLAESAAHPA